MVISRTGRFVVPYSHREQDAEKLLAVFESFAATPRDFRLWFLRRDDEIPMLMRLADIARVQALTKGARRISDGLTEDIIAAGLASNTGRFRSAAVKAFDEVETKKSTWIIAPYLESSALGFAAKRAMERLRR